MLAILGIARSFAWQWTMVPEQGTLRLMIVIQDPFLVFDGVHTFWLVLLLIGALSLAWSFVESDHTSTGPFASILTFYPFVFLLGILLTVYGVIYLFDVTTFADQTPGGFVVLLYLDYAGLTQRLIGGFIGLALTVVGLVLVIGWTLDRDRFVPRAVITQPIAVLPPTQEVVEIPKTTPSSQQRRPPTSRPPTSGPTRQRRVAIAAPEGDQAATR